MKKSKRRQRRGALRHSSERTAETMNENFIKVMRQQDENGNPPTGFAVMAKGGGKDSSACVELALRGASRLRYSTTTQQRMRRRQCGLYGKSSHGSKIWA